MCDKNFFFYLKLSLHKFEFLYILNRQIELIFRFCLIFCIPYTTLILLIRTFFI